jgi:peptidoglycan/LPS O-acetylase OafA/YrhL
MLTFAAAYVSYRFVEQPMLRFRLPGTIGSKVTNTAIDTA